jgi:hypothetical protein
MMVSEMVRRGVFGEIISAEGHYIHDCRDLALQSRDGERLLRDVPPGERGEVDLTWRGIARRDSFANTYPTHSLGPVCQWLGINRSDRLATTATWHSPAVAMADYVRRNVGPDHPLAEGTRWRLPDRVTTLLRTRRQVLVSHHFDANSPRPHRMTAYQLQGTHACFDWLREEPLVWIQDRSPTSVTGIAEDGGWQRLLDYADEFEHPLWRRHGDAAKRAGHGGGDYFLVSEFVDAIRERRPPAIDVIDAVTWSSIAPLSEQSMQGGNRPIEVPDFATGSAQQATTAR